jgi:hypothetical protein
MGAQGIRGIVYGVGAMGTLCGRLMVEKGVELVGGVTHTAHLGEDLGDVCGVGRLGVVVRDDADAVLAEARADIALVCVATFLPDMMDHLERCIRNDVNVITTAEEALYPWRTQPELTARLDRLAKEHGVSVLGSGYSDYYWGGEVMQLAGSCHRIERIEGVGRFNIDDYGVAVARNNHVGETVAEFEKAFREDTTPAFFQTVADLLCAGRAPKTSTSRVPSSVRRSRRATSPARSRWSTSPPPRASTCTSSCRNGSIAKARRISTAG